MEVKYDDTLFEILKETRTIPHFFDVIFGFLYRRTDFYHVSTDPNLGIGLPEGVGEKLVWQCYKKFKELPKSLQNTHQKEPTIKEVENRTVSKVINERIEDKSKSLESYNGAKFDNYSWSQTINDIDVQVKVPEKLISKNISVDITPTTATVKLKCSNTVIIQGEICSKCRNQETIWSLDGDVLQIHIEKAEESWWDCFLKSEPRLDFNKMDCSRPFHELSDEAQAKIEELSWNQERKRLGLPTSDQLKLEKTLKQAWNAEGSPFSGEYDPTKVILN